MNKFIFGFGYIVIGLIIMITLTGMYQNENVVWGYIFYLPSVGGCIAWMGQKNNEEGKVILIDPLE